MENVLFKCGCGTGYCDVTECWNPTFVAVEPENAKRLVEAREREMQLFDDGHSHESARAIVRGEMPNPDKMYNEDMRAGVLI